tara:strand:- start:108 stop:281 length:174 start_codon:yes stop_codon:yes gene_type:complete
MVQEIKIETVKKMEDIGGTLCGYLVNNVMTVPLDERNRHYKEVQAWVADGNTIEEPS